MLTDQSKRINLIISLGTASADTLRDWPALVQSVLEEEGACEYALALHDLDVDPATGQIKTPHIHVCAVMCDKKRLITWLNRFADRLNLNPLAISIEKLKDFAGAVRYLVHKDDPDKYQYDTSRIITTLKPDDLEGLLLVDPSRADKCSFESLVEICKQCSHKVDVAGVIGSSHYTHYYRLITDIWDMLHPIGRQ